MAMHRAACRRFFRFLPLLNRFLVVGGGFALLEGYRAGRARGQAIAESVAIVVPEQLCLAVLDPDRTFVAGAYAHSAAVTGIGVDLDYLSFHGIPPLSL